MNDKLGKEVWGKKTLKSDSMNKVGIRLLLLTIQNAISKHFIWETATPETQETLNNMFSSYLDQLKDRKVLNDSKVEVTGNKKTWKDLYPNFFDRMRAYFYYLILHKCFKQKLHYSKAVIWEHIFPFSASNEAIQYSGLEEDWFRENHQFHDEIDDELDKAELQNDESDYEIYWGGNPPSIDWIRNWFEENPPKAYYSVKLVIPYSYIKTILHITPIKATECVKINIELS